MATMLWKVPQCDYGTGERDGDRRALGGASKRGRDFDAQEDEAGGAVEEGTGVRWGVVQRDRVRIADSSPGLTTGSDDKGSNGSQLQARERLPVLGWLLLSRRAAHHHESTFPSPPSFPAWPRRASSNRWRRSRTRNQCR